MGLISEGIDRVVVLELPAGIGADGDIFALPRSGLVKWHSRWSDKLHQVYVNGRFGGATVDVEQRELVVQAPSSFETAVRIEVFAVEPSEADVDFSSESGGPFGESGRVKIRLLRSQGLPADGRFEVFCDNGAGQVDYGEPIGGMRIWPCQQDKAGWGLSRFGESDFGYDWSAGTGFGRGSFGRGEFGVDADIIEWTSPALGAGTYKFGVKVRDRNGNESAASETGAITVIPAARPAEGVDVESFEKDTNRLVLEVGS